MKRLISVLLVLSLFVTVVAFASDEFEAVKGTGDYAHTSLYKTSSTGSNGYVTCDENSKAHSMYYQIHKASGGAASEYYNTTSKFTDHPLKYNKDGYGNSLGRNGYEYKLRVAHRSQCSCDAGTTAVVKVSFVP